MPCRLCCLDEPCCWKPLANTSEEKRSVSPQRRSLSDVRVRFVRLCEPCVCVCFCVQVPRIEPLHPLSCTPLPPPHRSVCATERNFSQELDPRCAFQVLQRFLFLCVRVRVCLPSTRLNSPTCVLMKISGVAFIRAQYLPVGRKTRCQFLSFFS